MSKRELFDPYHAILGVEMMLIFIYLFGGILFLVFTIKDLSASMTYIFMLSWFSLFLSATCVAYLIILPYKDIHVLIHEKCAELTGEQED